jgi:hypothetical protein
MLLLKEKRWYGQVCGSPTWDITVSDQDEKEYPASNWATTLKCVGWHKTSTTVLGIVEKVLLISTAIR